ncbi:hypothetical protein D9757_003370 [Collybiopsis confluens]|uniref:Retrotransposon gag domain-containing protein n=1 Tax=Collybiopsis confluens TaxID=2823264 RepID=A0A8H5MFM8_9AGAR|nr:hypothetical protein D9757_003370 [Collybiopsis confluens]
MSSFNYENYEPLIQMEDVQNWDTKVTNNVNMEAIGFTTHEQVNQFGLLFRNAHETTIETVKNYVDNHMGESTEHMNEAFDVIYKSHEALKEEVKNLRQIIETQAELLKAYKSQIDKLPADAGSGSLRGLKVPEPPTFSGTDNKMSLEDWVNQVALFCSSAGIFTDHQKIVTALTRLRSPATTYMRKYFDNNRLGKDLGSWEHFIEELNAIYGRRDSEEGAKEEISLLWTNKELANKDFIKYAEQYRTLARLVEYEDKIHIDKLKAVISKDLRNAIVMFEVSGKLPTDWEQYLELLLAAYKALHPEKVKSTIFGNNHGKNNTGTTDPNAMEIDAAKKTKGKHTEQVNSQETKGKYCQICHGKGFKLKSKSHNTVDCWDKPGNESKKPAPRMSSSSSAPGHSYKGGQSAKGGKQSFKARLMELFDDFDNEPAPPAAALNVNSASIPEIVEPSLAAKEVTASVDEVQAKKAGPSRPRWAKSQQIEVDFPKGL